MERVLKAILEIVSYVVRVKKVYVVPGLNGVRRMTLRRRILRRRILRAKGPCGRIMLR